MTSPIESLLGFEQSAEEKAHHEAVARFVAAYAAAGAAVHVVARKLSGMPDDKARVVFARMRLPELIDSVKGLMKLNGTDEPPLPVLKHQAAATAGAAAAEAPGATRRRHAAAMPQCGGLPPGSRCLDGAGLAASA